MVLGMEDMDGGLFGPSTKQKREIQSYVQKAWQMWEIGQNPPEILKKLVSEAQEKAGGMYMDYFPPDPDWIESAIKNAFKGTDRKDYAFLGCEGDLGSAIKGHFFLPPLLDLFSCSKDSALPFYESNAPAVLMSQDWPPSISPAGSRQEGSNWDFESMLGVYHPVENKIVLYSRGIRKCSQELSLHNMGLAFIVCLHEVAHWCTHYYPIHGYDDPWDTISYCKCDDTIHETLSQWITFFCIKDRLQQLECFDRLNEHQSDKYKTYKRFIDVDSRIVIGSIKSLRESVALAMNYEGWQDSIA